MPLPPPPDEVIADADELERSPRPSPVADAAALNLLQIMGDAVLGATVDIEVTPVKS
jgi:hypothetical protein